MNWLARGRKTQRKSLINLVGFIPPVIVSVLCVQLSRNEISLAQGVLASALLVISWTSYLNWKKRRDEKLPVFAIISSMYWVYFGLALFWGARTPSGVDTPFESSVSNEAITTSLVMVLVGLCAAWLGMHISVWKYLTSVKCPELKPGKGSLFYLRGLLISSTALSLWESLPYAAGEGARQLITIFISVIPTITFCLVFRSLIRGEASAFDKFLVLAFLLLRLITGLSSGWLGSFAAIIVICGAVYVSERRRVPRFALILVVLFTLFFQVGKQEFRSVYWKTDGQANKIDRVKFWTATSLGLWQNALSDSSGEALGEAINSSLSRVSLLTQTANVVELTPDAVPYQQGRLYSYLFITWIPRALWPDKPSMNEANRFYQVAYGMSSEADLDNVSIAVGVLPESYINFGWYGVVGVMFLVGMFYRLYQELFFSESSGLLMTAIGVALLPQIIAIDSQMASYLGGVVQQVGFAMVLFLPVIIWKSRRTVNEPVRSAPDAVCVRV